MKSFIFQVLSKGLMLTILAAVAAGYYYRVELFPKWFDETPQASGPAPVAEATSVPAVADAVAVDQAFQSADVQVPAVVDENAPMFRPLETEGSQVADTPPEPATARPAEMVPAEQPAPVAAMPAEVQADAPASSIAEARQAYWDRDLEAAIAAYQRVIAQEPDNADAHGELGNVHFARRDAAAAAQAFLDAGLLLSKQGQQEQAASLVSVLLRLDSEKAAALSRALSGK